MTILSRYENNDGLEIYVDTATGEAGTSIRGYARLAGKNASTISRRFKGDAQNPALMAEVQTEGGIQGIAFIDENTIIEWLPKDNPEVTTQLLRMGIRKFLHTLVNYQPEQPKSQLALTAHDEDLRKHHEYLDKAEELERQAKELQREATQHRHSAYCLKIKIQKNLGLER